MNRLNNPIARTGLMILVMSLLAIFLGSCGGDDPVAPGTPNNAPTAPTIDTASGAPADGAVNVSPAAALHWTCSDPDGDPLTYTVRFGTAAEPPVVSENQSAASHTPASLANGTTYHWQVTAKDDGGKSTASSLWSFTTVAAAGETVSAPAAPTGPGAGETDASMTYTTAGAVSSEGHGLEYRFDWDDGTTSDWTASASVSHAWTTAGSYEVAAQARCATDTAVESAWSSALMVTVSEPAAEVVTRPNMPNGETTLETGVSDGYSTSGAYSTQSHTLEHRFDWDDGTVSDWANAILVNHAWSTAGNYNVTAQARCLDHPAVESVWSLPLAVTVQDAETVSTPNAADGPTTGEIQTSLSYDLSGATSSWGHAVEYRVDWGDGETSSWWAGTAVSHIWTTAGSYDVLVQGRCQDHPSVETVWSAATTVTVTEPAEIIFGTTMYNPPTGGGVDEAIEFRAYGGWTNLYHPVECRFDWGDGSFGDWVTSLGGYYYSSHAWSAAGTYEVRAQVRCIEHPEVVSEWSDAASFEVTDSETVSAPYFSTTGDWTFDVGDWIFPMVGLSESNMGHPVEYQIDLGDGTFTPWVLSAPGIEFATEGDFELRARARCREHTDIVSDWSESLFAHVVELEDVSVPTISGPATGTVGEPVTFTASGAVSSMGHDLEYQLYWSYDYGQIGTGLGWMTIDNLTTTFDSAGGRHMRVSARCITHPEVESNISNRIYITISE